ncbi:MAG: hypothetical protein ABI818_05770 [Acidobacteriota bacterium]
MAKRQNDDLRQWAVMGAEQRLLQIAEEAGTIFRAFPELRKRGFMAEDSRKATATTPAGEKDEAAAPRKRRKLSAAARKRIGDAQRKRWAKQKSAAAKG